MKPDEPSPKAQSRPAEEECCGAEPVEPAPTSSDCPGAEQPGPTVAPPSTGAASRDGGSGSSSHERDLRRRHRPRVPRLSDVDTLEDALNQAILRSDPSQVKGILADLFAFTRRSVLEAGRTRFQKTFGSPQCDRCEGLRAGPGVLATCFQIRQCYYSNVKQGDRTSRQERIVDILSKKQG